MGKESLITENLAQKMMIITPATTGGSWIFLHHLLEKLPSNFEIITVSLGSLDRTYRMQNRKYISIPYFNYEKYGAFITRIPILNFLFELPLLAMSSFLILVFRPHVVIANGFMAALGILLAAKMSRCKIIVSHRGYFRNYVGTLRTRIVRKLGKYFDCIFVNSEGSKNDVISIMDAGVIDESRILVVNHNADEIFFQAIDRDEIRTNLGVSDKFVVLFVGRIDLEKRTDLMIQVVDILKNDESFVFIFVGQGGLVPQILRLQDSLKNVRYMGRITDRASLRDIYVTADLVWSYADDTYLARPAVESLASGTPIIVPDEVALLLRRDKVPAHLIPSSIGWLVNTNAQDIALRIREIKNSLITNSMRSACKNYAIEHFSPKNLQIVVEKLLDILSHNHCAH